MFSLDIPGSDEIMPIASTSDFPWEAIGIAIIAGVFGLIGTGLGGLVPAEYRFDPPRGDPRGPEATRRGISRPVGAP